MGNVMVVQADAFIGVGDTILSYVPDYNFVETAAVAKRRGGSALHLSADIEHINMVSRPDNGFAAKPSSHAFVQVVTTAGETIKVFNRLGDASMKRQANGPPPPARLSDVISAAAGGALASLIQDRADEQQDSMAPGNGGEPQSTAWTDWILTSVSEQRTEKTQVVETFGSDYLYAFGEKPRSLQFDGLLFNTIDFNWAAEFWENWDRFFRATKLIERGAMMFIGYDDILVGGYPINAVASRVSDTNMAIRFSFTFYVTQYHNTAAKRGFAASAAELNPLIRTRPSTGYKARLRPTKSSTLAALVNQSNKIENPLLRRMVARLENGAFTVASGEVNALAFAKSFLFQSTREAFTLAANKAVQQAEEFMDLKSGEINNWFGYLGGVMKTLAQSSWDGPLTGSPSPSGDFFSPSTAHGLLMLGNTQRIIDSLAYATAGAIGNRIADLTKYSGPGSSSSNIATPSTLPKKYSGAFGNVFT